MQIAMPSFTETSEALVSSSATRALVPRRRWFRRVLSRVLPVQAGLWLGLSALGAGSAWAQTPPAASGMEPPPDQSVLGVLMITGDAQEHVTPLAILPSLSPDLEDVIVRGVVRRDFEISGMFKVIPDNKAPEGMYGFDDPVDVKAWTNLGAEVIIKVAARREPGGLVKIFGLCYFLSHGKEPVYQKTFVVKPEQVRVTAHRITDALLGAITGRNGGFTSHLTFSAKAAKDISIYTVDADGHDLRALSDPNDTSIAPFWGPNGSLLFSRSRKYSPFRLVAHQGAAPDLPFKTSIYSAAFSGDYKRLAVAVGNDTGSAIYVGNANGSNMQKVSNTEVATHPVFSPSGKLAWIGGGGQKVGQRVYVDGKPVSPPGFSAAAPTFCDTEDGVLLIYAVATGNMQQDLVMSKETGGQLSRLTQNEGSNSYPACSPDGRLVAYFSERSKEQGLFIKSLKSYQTQKISSRAGMSLRWAALP